jgi:transcriptional regulator with XRE-family HTH domain
MGNWLTELRVAAGYKSVRALSADSKIEVSTLARIENNVHIASPETLKRLAPYLKTPYIRLLAIVGHLADDPESQLAADFFRLRPVERTYTMEDEWPELCEVIRVFGETATPEERRRVANIVKASLGGK